MAIGKIGSAEIDFIATAADEKKYIQVTESMVSEDVRKRELAPLQSIRDNYEKIVLSLDPGLNASYDGIKSEFSAKNSGFEDCKKSCRSMPHFASEIKMPRLDAK